MSRCRSDECGLLQRGSEVRFSVKLKLVVYCRFGTQVTISPFLHEQELVPPQALNKKADLITAGSYKYVMKGATNIAISSPQRE
jgi:hypothetical protein